MVSATLSVHIKREIIINGVMNTLFNGVIAWWLLKDGGTLTLWGAEGFAIDLAATGTILLFIVALIVMPLNSGKVKKGKLEPTSWQPDNALHRLLQRLPASLFMRALCFALAGLMVLAPLTIAALSVFGIELMEPLNYAIFKGLWAGGIAALMTAPMILLAASVDRAQR